MEELKDDKNEIITLLEQAYKLSLNYEDGYSDNFLQIEDFRTALDLSIQKLKNENFEDVKDLLIWFSPSYDWDDLVGDTQLGNKIFSKLLKIEKHLSL